MVGDNKEKMKYWRGYGLNIPMSKTDSCAHTKNNHPDNECYTQLMTKHVFGLIEDASGKFDACANCSSYKPKMGLKDHLLCGKKKEAVIDV